MFRQCLKLDSWKQTSYRLFYLSCFLVDLGGTGLNLGRWWLGYLLLKSSLLLRCRWLTRGWFAGQGMSCGLLSLASLLTSSWALGWGRARWRLGCLLWDGTRQRRRCGLLLNCGLCLGLWLGISLGHWRYSCPCYCDLSSCSCYWLCWLSHKNEWQNRCHQTFTSANKLQIISVGEHVRVAIYMPVPIQTCKA